MLLGVSLVVFAAIQAVVLYGTFMLVNLVVDVLYAVFDPRVRL